MYCWRLKEIYSNGAYSVSYFNSLAMALAFAKCAQKEIHVRWTITWVKLGDETC